MGNESFTYDKNGNRLTDGTYSYTWDAADQVTAVTKKGETKPFVTYTYDEDGRRIQKVVGTTVTNYHYDGDSLNVLYETNGSNTVTKSYTYSDAGQLVAMKKGSVKYYYHYNAHGDVIGISDKDGNRLATYEYDAWGNPLKADETAAVKDNAYRYAGYQYDHETGMYYLMARYYEPKHGVFLSLDPDPGDEDDIITQNGYTYANNNPVMFVDPDGHYFWLAVNAGFAAYDGYKAYKAGKGWRGVGGAVASAFGPGKYVKGAKAALGFAKSYKLSRKKLATPVRSSSAYRNVTEKGSRLKNIQTNTSRRNFEKNLRRNGYKKSIHNKGVISMTKGGSRYTIRGFSKSTKGPTAEFFSKGSRKASMKIRLK